MNDYEKIGFRCGVEVHNRMDTKNKLFCKCPPRFSTDDISKVIKRKLRSVVGETGKSDIAALYESSKNRTYHYEIFEDTVCLTDCDSEPPHEINEEALLLALQVAKIFKAYIPDEIHVMRKIVVDGSNTSGFQRTMLIGMNGEMETSFGKVRIANICLEEESCGIVKKEGNNIVYRLDRLGIPLIEVGTEADIKNPQHAREVAKKIGMIIRSTGKSQRGLGVTRQDVNVSIKGGERIEIKGVQDLDLIPSVIDNEIERQKKLVLVGESKEETRVLRADGSTIYTRPLPGGERMYPETDVPVIVLDKDAIKKIKLPETWEEKLIRIEKKLPSDLAKQLIHNQELERWERLSKKFDPKLVAITLLSTVTDLRRKGIDTSILTDKHFQDVFFVIGKGVISKDVIGDVLEQFSREPKQTIGEVIALLGLEGMGVEDARLIVKDVIRRNPALAEQKKLGALMGDVMKEVRGKIDGKVIKKILEEELG